ncbi:MAG TPA: ABC transporter ATP-binding protein [Lachnospiraceae bacterium]|nr:ABC transporter ATP-binding protein [Lachnospiraceae bacterium]HCR82118.1 ABC transporter ATP-binding protein [Lachnospiraceae bacterium]
MAQIELENITKQFGDVKALDNVSLTVRDNEFFVLFGPAGAGKTTLLKTIAGAEFPEKGLVKIGGNIVNHVESKDRNVSMVFENYALYPNLSVYDNIASPMRSKLYKKDEDYIKTAVDKVTKMMKINHLLERKPSQLSNGQRQRVALGRCLVRTPNVFLMDEPLAHLDAKLRHFMRGELKEMQTSINSTTIYVTHDYMEAMSLADRIGVLNHGEIVQTGTAQEMYYTPCNEFVARLFGEPEINILEGKKYAREDSVYVKVLEQDVLLYPSEDTIQVLKETDTDDIHIGMRGNDIKFAFEKPGDEWLEGTIYANEPIGNKVIMTVLIGDTKLAVTCPNDTVAELDQKVYVKFNMMNAIYFNGETQKFIIRNNMSRYMAEKREG